MDTLELYSARQRAVYVKQAAEELGLEERVVKRELGEVLFALEERQEAEKIATQQKQERGELSDADRKAALSRCARPAVRSDSRRLPTLRSGGRRNEQARRLPGGDEPQARRAAGGDHPELERGGQDVADGRGAAR